LLRWSWCPLLIAVCLACPLDERVAAQRPTLRGVVVDEVLKDGSALAAGIQPDDVLLAWSRVASPPANPEPAQGDISSPFELIEIEYEQAPRGTVTLEARRERAAVSFALPERAWRLRTRPQMPDAILSAWKKGKSLLVAKDVDNAMAAWREAAAAAKQQNDSPLVCWLSVRIGDALRDARQWSDAQVAYDAALREATATGDLRAQAVVWGSVARTLESSNNLAKAFDAYQEALRSREKMSPDGLAVAVELNTLGSFSGNRGDVNRSEEFNTRALTIRQKLAPGSLAVAQSLNNLGVAAQSRGDLTAADDFDRKALAIAAKLAPGSRDEGLALANLGVVTRDRGDLAGAEDYYRSALAIFEKVEPDSLLVALTLNNLGVVAMNRLDLDASESLHKRALAIREKVAPGSLAVAMSLNNLGTVAQTRGDLAAARDFFMRTLEIREKLATASSLTVARSLYNLGDVALRRGDLAEAEDFFRRTLTIREKEAPGSLEVAVTLGGLAHVSNRRGDLAAAKDLLTRSLALQEKLAPTSADTSGTLHDLGALSWQSGDAAAASQYLRRAIDTIESQLGQAGGGDEARSGFAAHFLSHYRDYAEVLIAQHQPAEAFHVLERSRARGLLSMLAERDLMFSDVPAELERQRKLTDVEYDRTQSRIAGLSSVKDTEEIERLLAHLQDIRDRQATIREQIRKASPRLAALQYPEPLDLAGVQRTLDPGTLMLSYLVTDQKTFLFVVDGHGARHRDRSGVSVIELTISEAALREKIERFRNGIQSGARLQDAWVHQSQELYNLLIRPATRWLDTADRVVISPDGPLHVLPFAALVTDASAEAGTKTRPRYWIERQPVHVVVSGTLYAELRKGRKSSTGTTLVAFADPKTPSLSKSQAETAANQELRLAARGGYSFEPLPGTRAEVQAIANVFSKQATMYVGDRATEERVKAIGRDVRYIHFATHGFLNERMPLNSALVLTMPETPADGQDNGLLQAWEILEQLRIDADLVVLSACETGLGKEIGGEGLVGLTRAFQYAGARSIVASLWSVADESTPELMKRFYRYLTDGKSKDEALRAAQIDLIRSSSHTSSLDTSHPFHWAAFQLIGDWR
jgi:CHAT domain-containing protein/Tfp pilus assembly protein PilF